MQFPIMIGLRRSRFLAVALLLVHGLSIAGILATPWPLEIRAALSVLGLLSLLMTLRRSGVPVEVLHLAADGGCSVVCANGQTPEPCTLLPGFYAHSLLTVLRVQKNDASVVPLVILPDSMAADDHRRLRVWLRYKAKIGAATDV